MLQQGVARDPFRIAEGSVPPGDSQDTQDHAGAHAGQAVRAAAASSPPSRNATDGWWPAAAAAAAAAAVDAVSLSYVGTTPTAVVVVRRTGRQVVAAVVMTKCPQDDCGVRSTAAPSRPTCTRAQRPGLRFQGRQPRRESLRRQIRARLHCFVCGAHMARLG